MSYTKIAQITAQYGPSKPVRWNDANLCIWGGCDELRYQGTGFCEAHYAEAVERSIAEMHANRDHELAPECWALDIEDGQAA